MKVSSVAYSLQLPLESMIYLEFHIALLKPYQGDPPNRIINPLPPLATESHPVIYPSKIVAYRIIKQKGRTVRQVLVEWVGLPREHRSWEDFDSIQRLIMNDSNLEDKIILNGHGDVTIELDLEEIVTRLKKDLGIFEEDVGDRAKDDSDTGATTLRRSLRDKQTPQPRQ